jgi:putative oxidoreductase
MKTLLKTNTNDISALILRITLGFIMFPHGAQKLLGWFGGFGFSGSIGYFTETIGLPWIVAFLFVLAESIGSFLLIIGIGTRVIAASFVVIMAGAAYTHSSYGFFMNWFGNQAGEGIEFHLLMMLVAFVVVLTGGGKASVDGLFYQKKIIKTA